MINTIGLVNMPIPLHNYLFVLITFKIYSLNNFQVYNSIGNDSVLYVRSPELTHRIARYLCPLINICTFTSLPTPSQLFLYSISRSLAFYDSTYKWEHTVFIFFFLTIELSAGSFPHLCIISIAIWVIVVTQLLLWNK